MQNLDRFNFKIAIIEVDNQTSIYDNIQTGIYDVFSIRWEDDGLYVKFYDYSKKGFYADYLLQEVNQNNCKFQLLQCTGLKDKNGKLIFEGDIVQVHIKEHKKDTLITPNFTYGVCKWYMYSFFIQKIENNTNPTKKVLSIDFFDTLEIIGNKFLNPELIENI